MAKPSSVAGRIDLPDDQKEVVSGILRRLVPTADVRVFGSRATGRAKPYSDLDLAIAGIGPMPLALIAELNEAFQESSLPIKVDVVDMATVSPEFREIIEKTCVRW